MLVKTLETARGSGHQSSPTNPQPPAHTRLTKTKGARYSAGALKSDEGCKVHLVKVNGVGLHVFVAALLVVHSDTGPTSRAGCTTDVQSVRDPVECDENQNNRSSRCVSA